MPAYIPNISFLLYLQHFNKCGKSLKRNTQAVRVDHTCNITVLQPLGPSTMDFRAYNDISRNLVSFPCDFHVFQPSCCSAFCIMMAEVHNAISRREYEFVTKSWGKVELELRMSSINNCSICFYHTPSHSLSIHSDVVATLTPLSVKKYHCKRR
jgi:hypothetical protein